MLFGNNIKKLLSAPSTEEPHNGEKRSEPTPSIVYTAVTALFTKNPHTSYLFNFFLPKHRPYDCKIDLQERSMAPWGPIYPLSEEELRTLREWLTEMEKTGKIKRSTSPAGSPILFVPKPHGRGLHLYVDYRALNRITIPNRYPLSLM